MGSVGTSRSAAVLARIRAARFSSRTACDDVGEQRRHCCLPRGPNRFEVALPVSTA